MLEILKSVLPSGEQWEIIVEGMRNPMNSWDKSDSEWQWVEHPSPVNFDEQGLTYVLGDADLDLARRLSRAGADHAKFRRMIPVYLTINAPLYWWKEYDTYKIGTVANSCSTMHKIHAREFTTDDFSGEYLKSDDTLFSVIDDLNFHRSMFLDTGDRDHWYALIQLLPSSYNQRRTVLLNYETLSNIYHARRNHKLTEWHTLCDFIETLPHSELITGEASDNLCSTPNKSNPE